MVDVIQCVSLLLWMMVWSLRRPLALLRLRPLALLLVSLKFSSLCAFPLLHASLNTNYIILLSQVLLQQRSPQAPLSLPLQAPQEEENRPIRQSACGISIYNKPPLAQTIPTTPTYGTMKL